MGSIGSARYSALFTFLLLASSWGLAPGALADLGPVEGFAVYHFREGATMTAGAGDGAAATHYERDDAERGFTQHTEALAEDLSLARDGVLKVHLANRSALASGTFHTRVLLSVLDAQGNPLRGSDGAPVRLAESKVSAERAPHAPETPASDEARVALDVAEDAASALEGVWGDGPSTAMHLALRTTCRQSYDGKGTDMPYFCDSLYGDPSFGNIRPCRSDNPYYAPYACDQLFGDVGVGDSGYVCTITGQMLYRLACNAAAATCAANPAGAVGTACAPFFGDNAVSVRACREGTPHYTPALDEAGGCNHANLAEASVALARNAPPFFQNATRASDAIADLREATLEEDDGSEGWTILSLPLRVHPDLPHDEHTMVVPMGHRLQLELITTHDGASDTLPASAQAATPVASFRYDGDDAPSRMVLPTRVVPALPTPVVLDTFEDGDAAGWNLTGLWHVDAGCLGAASSTYSLQYTRAGFCDYNETAENGDPVRSHGIARIDADLRGARWEATLGFVHRFHVEQYNSAYDRMSVVVTCHGTSQLLQQWDSRDASPTPWLTQRYDVSRCLGDVMSIELRFDTIDMLANNHPGWAVDDFFVSAS